MNIAKLLLASFLLVSLLPSTNTLADSLNCPCKVVKVSDGDTIHALDQSNEKHKIRLSGIDAPEKKQAFGQISEENLSDMVAGKFIEVEYSKRDQYKRIVGKLVKDGLDINLQQVKDGYAWHYKHYQNEQSPKDRELYSSAEIEARNKGIGLWSAPVIPPWEFRRNKKK